jgi:hypothetical protein
MPTFLMKPVSFCQKPLFKICNPEGLLENMQFPDSSSRISIHQFEKNGLEILHHSLQIENPEKLCPFRLKKKIGNAP